MAVVLSDFTMSSRQLSGFGNRGGSRGGGGRGGSRGASSSASRNGPGGGFMRNSPSAAGRDRAGQNKKAKITNGDHKPPSQQLSSQNDEEDGMDFEADVDDDMDADDYLDLDDRSAPGESG